jgi:hypothetical protein
MSLHSIGLKLERAIVDDETDTHAYVAVNSSEQVEGEEDSIIVVSFRGTASVSNMKTDLSFRQVRITFFSFTWCGIESKHRYTYSS